MIIFACSGCGKKLQVEESQAGRKARCPYCTRVVQVAAAQVATAKGAGESRLLPASVAATLDTPPPVPPVCEPARAFPREAFQNPDTGSAHVVTHSGIDSCPTPSSSDAISPPDAASHGRYNFLAPPQRPDEIGRLGPYRVLKVLGAGGMGVVFQAEEPQLRRLVAVKAMLPSIAADPQARARFLREAQAAAAVEHDHVVHINHVGEDRGVPFVVMPLLKGESLDDRLNREGRLPVAEVLRLGREVAEGLAAAHERGLIHRDIKPGNVWLEAPRGRVKILDFGLARAVQDDTHVTQPGALLGTPAYMAPEQAQGSPLDARCDLFSLGCVLHRACTGALPFTGNTNMAVLMSVAWSQPAAPQDVNPEVPPELSQLILRLLAKDPADRPASACAVVEALTKIERDRTDAIPPSDTGALRPAQDASHSRVTASPAAGRWRRAWPAAAAATVLLAGLLLWGATVVLRTRHGTLTVTTAEPDVKVYVDGTERITVDSTKVGKIELSPGEHTMTVKRGGEELYTTQFNLKSGDTEVIRALWEPRPAAPASKVAASPIDRWAETVAALTPEQQVEAVAAKLKELNSGFDGKLTPIIDRHRVIGLTFLVDSVTDLTPLRALPALDSLTGNGGAAGEGRLSDLGPLRGLRLGYMSIANTAVADLRPLQGMPLRQLHCPGTQVKDLSPLRGMPLTVLDCEHTPVADLSPLQGLPLRQLQCDFRPERDEAVLRAIPTLETINRLPAAEFWKKAGAERAAGGR